MLGGDGIVVENPTVNAEIETIRELSACSERTPSCAGANDMA